MGTDPVWRLLVRFFGPAIISMVVAASYNLVDAIFIGRLGAEALAAITVAFPMALAFIFSVSWVAIELRKQKIPILATANALNAT